PLPPLSLHDALPISADPRVCAGIRDPRRPPYPRAHRPLGADEALRCGHRLRLVARDQGLARPLPVEAEYRLLEPAPAPGQEPLRSEEHTSELQSRSD